MRHLRLLHTTVLSGALLTLPVVASAQSSSPVHEPTVDEASPAVAARQLDPLVPGDIVVTARRRDENLQDVPVAITAFSAATLNTRNISEIASLDGLAPNVKVIESGSNTATYIQIRGSVTTNPNPGYEPAAALYVDGVYIGKSAGSTIDVADIDHIEVLRGPQGTLFGRNTLSGAINIVTRKPSGVFGGTLKLGVGNYDRRLLQGNVDLPAFGDVSIKLAGLWSARNGYQRTVANPIPGIPGQQPTVKRQGDQRNQALRAAVRYKPSNTLVFDYTVDFNRIRNTPLSGVLQSVGAGGIFDPASAAYVGVPLGLFAQTGDRPKDYFGTSGVDGAKLFERVRNWTHSLTGAVDIGDATLKSITAYRKLKYSQSLDLDSSPLPLASAGTYLRYRQFSQELQLSGKTGRLQYTGGLFYFHDKGNINNPQQFFGSTIQKDAIFTTNAYAAYGQVDWTPAILSDKLTITAGLRYSEEKKTVERAGAAGGVVTIPAGTRANKTFHGSTPTIVAKYDVTDDVNVYAKYSEGFKSGGFSTDASTIQSAITPYDPETVNSIEIGSKVKIFDGRLRINAAAFFDTHKDQQIAVFAPTTAGFVTLTSNDAKSKIKGFEIEVQAAPTDGLLISANVGHTNPKFKEFFEVVGGPNVAATRAFAFVPRWTAGGSVDVTVINQDALRVNAMVDVTYNSRYAALPYSTSPNVDPNIYSTQADSAGVVDGRLVASKIPLGSTTLQVSAFVKNIFNDASRTAGIDFGQAFGNIVTRNYNSPRTYGLDLTVKL